jgi:type IV pilus assembly protein PilC
MIYSYTAYSYDKRIVSGTIESVSVEMAENTLYKAGFLRILKLQKHSALVDWKKLFGERTKVSRQALLDFTQELAILLDSGLTLLMALRQLEKQSSGGAMRKVIGSIASELQGGTPFSQALGLHPQVFNETYCSIMEANEKAGTLDSGLKQIAKELKQQIAVRSQIQRSITQPMIIIGLAIAVVFLMVIFVLPQLAGIFRQFGAELPLITRALIWISDFVNGNLLTIVVVIVIIALAIFILMKRPKTKQVVDKWMLTLPIFGTLTTWHNTAHVSRTLSNLLGAGILLPDSINIMLRSISNSYFRDAMSQARKQLVQGQALSSVLSQNKMFPPLLVEMVGVGEASGNLESALGTVADYFEARVERRITRLTSLLEPALIIAVGLVVALLALSMIQTIYGLVGSFGG